MISSRALSVLASALTLGMAFSWAAPAMADLDRGFEAWDRGDYTTAVREWRDLAASGDADAQFNMAQAYRLGRGVEQNSAQAEVLIAKAAAQGHIRAIDTYGLLLFQSGRREEAMPYVIASADRGNPRAQYLLGIGHFNGDLVGKDWVRAYALMTLSNAEGFEPAKMGLAQMDNFIPMDQRQQAQLLAQTLKQNATAKRSQQFASRDLGIGTELAGTQIPSQSVPRSAPSTAPLPTATSRIPQAIRSTSVPPSVAAARAAVAEASRVTGTESPAQAGADFARPDAVQPRSEAPPIRTAAAPRSEVPKPTPAATPKAAPAASSSGPWRIQLGAFSVPSNADKLWSRLASNAAISGKSKFIVPAGRVVKLQVGGYPNRSGAQTACDALKRSGQDCIVTK
ncbi:hypothetical protein GCM10023115_10580 [Pontixanthobacter gangjinensis]|uniref:Sporulation protein n=1 Tax=Pontixanthobacter gangjinensis TaxID=1028742 RepID=A0A6I4SKX2_9SPHN|nr:SPOR domain-containing protein [Pontixanthobacter gangjinensis]MXO56304.1 sporulation protein [Pontixanthobacter gangjinensis]